MAQQFFISIENSVIRDLKARLSKTRWPTEVDNDRWEAGTNKAYLKNLCEYWLNDFDWKQQESYLNSFRHFKSSIDGTDIHFIHEKGKGRESLPLLLIHGYPDSFVRFLKLIPLLTAADQNDQSFDVVVPSIPGYGFSALPEKAGMDTKKIAGLFSQLMTKELGYEKFISQGGDWGGVITEQLALYHPEDLLGVHLTELPFHHILEQPDDISAAEKKFFEKIQLWQQKEGAYTMIQSTKPQSLAYGLNDSPAGLAGWMIEKFNTWSDNGGHIENAFTKDELLTNLTIYWTTETISSAIRIYYEEIQSIMAAKYNPLVKFNPFDKTGKKARVPAGFAFFPKDNLPPKEFVERFFDVKQWSELQKGGHFAAMEQPELLAGEIRKFAGVLSL